MRGTAILLQARMGSARLAGKSMRDLAGHTLVAHAIVRLQASGVGATVFNDGAVDTLTGGLNNDWFFRSLGDSITDLALGESVDVS